MTIWVADDMSFFLPTICSKDAVPSTTVNREPSLPAQRTERSARQEIRSLPLSGHLRYPVRTATCTDQVLVRKGIDAR